MEEQNEALTPEVAATDAPAQESGLDVVNETIVFAVTRNIAKPDAEPGFGVLKEGNALWKKTHPAADGSTEAVDAEIVFSVTVEIPVAHTMSGLSQIVTDEEELVNLANSGIYDKIVSQVRAKYTQRKEGEFVYGEETIDATSAAEIASTPLKRRAMTETQKLLKVLKGASANDLSEVLRAMGILS